MPKNKTETRQKIISAAKAEFLKKGFEQASLRNIAMEAGMSAAGLYRHFTDKEALFAALVDPVLDKLENVHCSIRMRDYEYLKTGLLDEMWGDNAEIHYFLDLIYDYFEEFKLLICCSAGTKYENFIHDFVMLEQKETLEYMEAARKQGISVRKVEPRELHLLLSAYATAVFEVVVHDFSKKEAAHYLSKLQVFFYPGWRAVLGL